MKKIIAFCLCFILIGMMIYNHTNVSASQVDTTPPNLNSIEVSPKNASGGNVVTVKAKLTDISSGVKSVSIRYDSPSWNTTRKSKEKTMTFNKGTASWDATITIDPSDESGIWTFTSMTATDNAGNKIDFKRESILYRYNVAAWDFTVVNDSKQDTIPPTLSSMVVSKQKVMVGNVLTMKAKLSDDRSGVKSVTIKYNSPSWNTTRKSKEKTLTFNKSTASWDAAMTIDPSDESGIWKFASMTAIDAAGNKIDFKRESIQYRYNVSAWDFTVAPGTGIDKVKPTISGAANKAIAFNSTFNALKDVKATDLIDGNVISRLKVTGSVNTKKLGTYKLIYTVTDKAGNKTTVTRTITVFDHVKPTISGAANKTIKLNSKFNPRTGVSAKDNVDGKLTKSIKVTGKVNTKKKGTYTLTYTVTDKSKNKATVTRKITIK